MSIRVTDHALVRFIERAGGLDVERMRSMIERSLDRAARAAGSINSTSYSVHVDGLIYVVRDNSVTTVLRSEWCVDHVKPGA